MYTVQGGFTLGWLVHNCNSFESLADESASGMSPCFRNNETIFPVLKKVCLKSLAGSYVAILQQELLKLPDFAVALNKQSNSHYNAPSLVLEACLAGFHASWTWVL